jgi:hypothetical protein
VINRLQQRNTCGKVLNYDATAPSLLDRSEAMKNIPTEFLQSSRANLLTCLHFLPFSFVCLFIFPSFFLPSILPSCKLYFLKFLLLFSSQLLFFLLCFSFIFFLSPSLNFVFLPIFFSYSFVSFVLSFCPSSCLC